MNRTLATPEDIARHNQLVGMNSALDLIGRMPLIEAERIEADLLDIAKNTPELMENDNDDETPGTSSAP